MPAPKVRADYDALAAIAKEFGAHATQLNTAVQRVKTAKDALVGGDWVGQGATTFYSEMDGQVLPALQRLITALQTAQQRTLQIRSIMQDAEKYAAACFRYEAVDGKPFIRDSSDARAIDPNDVTQGGAGDCYLLASLASIAQQNPALIRDMIQKNPDGTYTVTFHEKNNQPPPAFNDVNITVTPDFPLGDDGEPIFAQEGDTNARGQRELWVMLAEKAYAQWKGDYYDIGQGGRRVEALSALTGLEATETATKDLTFDQLQAAHDNGEAVTAGTPKAAQTRTNPLFNGTDPDGRMLVNGHAYYVVDTDPTNQTVAVRNPWGWDKGEITLTFAEFQSAFYGVATVPLPDK